MVQFRTVNTFIGTIAVGPTEQVASIKRRVSELCDVTVDHMVLVHRGKLLANSSTVAIAGEIGFSFFLPPQRQIALHRCFK